MLRFVAVFRGLHQAAGAVEYILGQDAEFDIDSSGLSLLQVRVESGPRKEGVPADLTSVVSDTDRAVVDWYPPFGQRAPVDNFEGLVALEDHSKVALRKSFSTAALNGEDPLWHPHSLERILIVPEHKLMVCLTDESPVSELLNILNGKTGGAAQNALGSSAIAHFGWSEAQTRLALESHDWYKAVFLRDPLERLHLAFSRECTSRAGSNSSACPFFEDDSGDRGHDEDPVFSEFVELLAQASDRFPHRFTGMDRKALVFGPSSGGGKTIGRNPHFTPQSLFCGGLNASNYDLVGDFARDMHHQLGMILATIGATGHEEILDRLYHPSAYGSEASSVIHRAEYQQRYSYVDTVLAARRIYDKDYQLLELATDKQQKPAQVCINTIFALDFEKRRILDWIAYHSLLGVDCFYLFHDTHRSDMSDPEIGDVYNQLMDSPNVTVFTADTLRDRGRLANTEQWFKYFPARYLLIIDVDEFVVIDSNQTHSSAKNSTPPSLFGYLEAMDVVGQGAAGVYLNRWDYGTSGHRQPPALNHKPEFAFLTERWGATDRVKPQKALGKLILNMQAGFPKYLSVHRWNPKGGGSMLFPNGTAMCLQACGHNAHDPMLPASRQPMSLNHYATGSLLECQARATLSQFSRDDRHDECLQLHPGTEAYKLLSGTDKVAQDPVLVKYAHATRERRAALFHSARALAQTKPHVQPTQ